MNLKIYVKTALSEFNSLLRYLLNLKKLLLRFDMDLSPYQNGGLLSFEMKIYLRQFFSMMKFLSIQYNRLKQCRFHKSPYILNVLLLIENPMAIA